MLSQLTIPRDGPADPALDWGKLYALGLSHVQQLASRIWTDYNVHLSYRAAFPVEDLLASETGNAEEMKKQFFTPRQILPSRPLTLLDYRKLIIDLKGVKNAWLSAATLNFYADTIEGKLLRENSGLPGVREVSVRGLYDVTIEYMDDVTSAGEKTKRVAAA